MDTGTQVEDTTREAQVIASAIEAGESRALDQKVMSNFFRSQIEANRLVQYSLLAEWRRAGKAPDHAPVDLAGTTDVKVAFAPGTLWAYRRQERSRLPTIRQQRL